MVLAPIKLLIILPPNKEKKKQSKITVGDSLRDRLS